ncbi:MAG TPA: hypothetical protein VF188_03065 [Longimicrobiales bacterium]
MGRHQDRSAANAAGPDRPEEAGEDRFEHVAIGYVDRRDLDDFIDGEQGDVTIHGPIHTGRRIEDVATLGTGATEGTPCLVVPLIRERIGDIHREVSAVLDRYEGRPRKAPRGRRPRTLRETGGTARGTTSGAIRTGSRDTGEG